MKTLLKASLFAICFYGSPIFAQPFPDFLQGTWKIDQKESYEEWELITVNFLSGKSFKIENGKIIVKETITIKKQDDKITYTATVFDQNEGRSIDFILVQKNDDTFSFENSNHDFPKKIMYQKKSDNAVYVQVLGTDDKGFSFNMQKIKSDIPQWFLNDLKNQIGVWETDNSKYKSEDEPFEKYVVEWHWSVDETSMNGFLYGMIGKKKTGNFWEYKQYWNAEENKAVLIQTGYGGRTGAGTILPMKENETKTIQTFSSPDAPSYLEKHISILNNNKLTTVSLNKDSLGNWIPKRTYVWNKKPDFQNAKSKLDTLSSGELMLTQQIIINSPLQKVWNAYTIAEEWKKWVTPVVEMDFRINGTIKSHYDSTATIGDKGTIVNHILNYIPEKQITMQAELNENFPQFMQGEEKNLYSIVEFEKITNRQTKISLYGIGYKNEAKWHELIAFFIKGNEMTLNKLKTYLEQK